MHKRRGPPHFIPPLLHANEENFHTISALLSPSMTSSMSTAPSHSSRTTFRAYPSEFITSSTPLSPSSSMTPPKDISQQLRGAHFIVQREDPPTSIPVHPKPLRNEAYTSLRRIPQLARLPRSLGPPGDMETELRRIKAQQCKLYSSQVRRECKERWMRKQQRKQQGMYS